jgi:hypothetical protein
MIKRDSATDFHHPLLPFIPSPLGEKVAEGRMRGRLVNERRIRRERSPRGFAGREGTDGAACPAFLVVAIVESRSVMERDPTLA